VYHYHSGLLFAGAYSACYHGGFSNAAKKLGTAVEDSTVRALVSLIQDDQGGSRLAAELYPQLPGLDRAQAQSIMDEAHYTCPYPKALHDNMRGSRAPNVPNSFNSARHASRLITTKW
jgi:lipoyl-dependent peroxiredoxin